MAGKRLLDIAALVNASRGVAQKHVALRTRQLEMWNKTSSVAKAVKSQTDRVTETANAASFLAWRLNENTPPWTVDAAQLADGRPVPEVQRAEEEVQQPSSKAAGLEKEPDVSQAAQGYAKQDFSRNTTSSKPSHDWKLSSPDHARELQRQFERQIPSHAAGAVESHSDDKLAQGHDEDTFYKPDDHASAPLSSLPRVKIPKQTSTTQANDEHVDTAGINSDTYTSVSYDSGVPKKNTISQEEVPEGIDVNLFYSPRVAKKLGGRTQNASKRPTEGDTAKETKQTDTNGMSSTNQKSTFTPAPWAKRTSPVNSKTDDVADLAQEIAKAATNEPDVSNAKISKHNKIACHEFLLIMTRVDGIKHGFISYSLPDARIKSTFIKVRKTVELWRSRSRHVWGSYQ
jgi:aarF domain-containing kinase